MREYQALIIHHSSNSFLDENLRGWAAGFEVIFIYSQLSHTTRLSRLSEQVFEFP